ncbi:MAG TPA: TIGR03435 family protein [Acidobacteriaceae bacterium]|nr:TIGR03435 family protein [Acidobacteriaceae bacterium]
MHRRIVATTLLTCGIALGQASFAPTQTTPAKPLAFEVVSIHPAKPGTNMIFSSMTTPDGYRVPGQALWYTIMMAYFPQGMAYWSKDRISGAPSWLGDQYEIDAKVSVADLAEWQKQGLSLDKKPMLQQMLQTMLADRCHLVAHMAPGPSIAGWSLELGKRGQRFTESKPGATLPVGVKLLGGGVMVGYARGEKPIQTFYSATMQDFAQYLSMRTVGHPVIDHTGLTGHYDFVLNWIQDPDSKLPEGVVDSDDPDPLSHWDINGLGLHVTPINLPADTLVIDHIEKPSEN